MYTCACACMLHGHRDTYMCMCMCMNLHVNSRSQASLSCEHGRTLHPEHGRRNRPQQVLFLPVKARTGRARQLRRESTRAVAKARHVTGHYAVAISPRETRLPIRAGIRANGSCRNARRRRVEGSVSDVTRDGRCGAGSWLVLTRSVPQRTESVGQEGEARLPADAAHSGRLGHESARFYVEDCR